LASPRRYVTAPPQAPQKIRPFPEEIIAVEFWTGLPSGLAGLLTTPAELAPPAGGAMTPGDARTILVAAAARLEFLQIGSIRHQAAVAHPGEIVFVKRRNMVRADPGAVPQG